MREGAILHAGDENDREFEALGGVHGHEGDLPAALALRGHLVRVCDESDTLEKVREGPAGRVGREGTGDRVQFRQVFHARGVLRVFTATQFGEVAGAVQDFLQDVGLGRPPCLSGTQGFDESPKGGRRLGRTRCNAQDLGSRLRSTLGRRRGRGRSRALIHTVTSTGVLPRRSIRGNGSRRISRGLVRGRGTSERVEVDPLAFTRGAAGAQPQVTQGCTKGDAVVGGVRGDGLLGFGTDAALGDVEDAAGCDGVVGVGDELQVRQRVLDFAALVEARATDDAVRDTLAHEEFLKRT